MSEDPQRIRPILDLLRLHWERNPDLRLGQIVTNLTRAAYGEQEANAYSIFNISDEELRMVLRSALLYEALKIPS